MSSDGGGDAGEFVPAPDEPAEVAALDTPRSEKVAMAWKLHVADGHPITYVAQKLGVARDTAWRMANEGRAQAALIPWLEREQVKLGQQVQLRAMRSWLYSDAEVDGGKALEYVPVLLKVLEAEMKVVGTAAPVKVDGTFNVSPDPNTIAAIEATMQRRQGQDTP